MVGLLPALTKAHEALAGVSVPEEPQGYYRGIEFWAGERPVKLLMQDVVGVPRFDIPEFEAAWLLVVQQFPECR